ERRVPEGEDAAVLGREPVAAAVRRAGDAALARASMGGDAPGRRAAVVGVGAGGVTVGAGAGGGWTGGFGRGPICGAGRPAGGGGTTSGAGPVEGHGGSSGVMSLAATETLLMNRPSSMPYQVSLIP